MTREEAAKWAELYQAYADGKVIQCIIGDTWIDINGPAFCNSCDQYRIKPEPKKAEFWVNVYGEHFGEAHSSKSKADASADAITKLRTACLHIVREYEEGEGL